MHQAIANRCNGVRNDYIRNSRMRTSILPIVDSGPLLEVRRHTFVFMSEGTSERREEDTPVSYGID